MIFLKGWTYVSKVDNIMGRLIIKCCVCRSSHARPSIYLREVVYDIRSHIYHVSKTGCMLLLNIHVMYVKGVLWVINVIRGTLAMGYLGYLWIVYYARRVHLDWRHQHVLLLHDLWNQWNEGSQKGGRHRNVVQLKMCKTSKSRFHGGETHQNVMLVMICGIKKRLRCTEVEGTRISCCW